MFNLIMYVSDFYKKLFGCKVYKISLDAGCTCPTRDGTIGTGGCIFCSASGSGDFAASRNKPIKDQITEAKEKVSGKIKDGKYIAYFQNFTNTYGNPEHLYSLYCQALEDSDVVGISIATRPDCLSEEILFYIKELSQKTFVQIELGFQTSKEESAAYIRRGFSNEVYEEAVKKIHQCDFRIHVVTHVILGLPSESEQDMKNTVIKVIGSGSDGIKLSVLHVLKGTDLEKDYEKGLFKTMEEEEYYRLLEILLKEIPEKMVIHRLTGDGPKALLISPLWTGNKRRVHNEISRRFQFW